jgi:hypothetical protein
MYTCSASKKHNRLANSAPPSLTHCVYYAIYCTRLCNLGVLPVPLCNGEIGQSRPQECPECFRITLVEVNFADKQMGSITQEGNESNVHSQQNAHTSFQKIQLVLRISRRAYKVFAMVSVAKENEPCLSNDYWFIALQHKER